MHAKRQLSEELTHDLDIPRCWLRLMRLPCPYHRSPCRAVAGLVPLNSDLFGKICGLETRFSFALLSSGSQGDSGKA